MAQALTSMRRCFYLHSPLWLKSVTHVCRGLKSAALGNAREEKRSPVGRLDFKSSKGRQSILGGFDSHSLPPNACRVLRRFHDCAEAFSACRPC